MSDEEQHPFPDLLPKPMNAPARTEDGRAIVPVFGNSLGETARPGHKLILKEVDSPLVNGGLYLFSNGPGLIYRRVKWKSDDTVALVPENDESSTDPIVLTWPEDEDKWEVVARVDKVLKPL